MRERRRRGRIRRNAVGIVDEGLKALKKQSACLIASQSDDRLVPDATGMMSEGRRPGDIQKLIYKRYKKIKIIIRRKIIKCPIILNLFILIIKIFVKNL